ncbi:transporter substrate-binding domain-containing protein [uncultured Jannaschia sp.]|uniref:transporter substrate-binding domain-containing protein n=1 Tax=uncultured Jannaschia sp. TaxID=293347 RepID=UPI002634DC8C|nr:transporter substrate-binding domain-containing protein [uncultured Jannaschia sp.]
MIYICDEVLKQMLIEENDTPDLLADQIKAIDIDNLEQGTINPNEDRLNLLGDKFDILCDPATIDRERVRQYAVSPPLFVTGIGFLQREGRAPALPSSCTEGKALIGVVGATNAVNYGVNAILRGREWNRYRNDIYQALNDSLECPGRIISVGSSHTDVARRFCSDKEEISYYVGDLEIISAHARLIPGCNFITSSGSFTYDRYGIFARIDYKKEKEKALLLTRFFEVLNREIMTSDSLLDRAYFAEFGERARSPALETFFWSIRGAP